MLRIQFKKKKLVAEQEVFRQQPSTVYGGQRTTSLFGEGFGGTVEQNNPPTREPNGQPQQDDGTCVCCGNDITGPHLVVTIKNGDHCIHTNCIVSGFAMLFNGLGLLIGWIMDRKGRR